MHISQLKRKESFAPPQNGDEQFDRTEHICESCGKWAMLTYWDVGWICQPCIQRIKMGYDQSPEAA